MNKPLVFSGIAVIVLCVSIYGWTHSAPTKKAVTPQTIAQNEAKVVNAIAPAAGQTPPTPPLAPATTVQKAVVPAAAPVAATTTPAASAQPTEAQPQKASDLSPQELAAVQQELKDTLATQFKDKLSFPMDETKMIAYAQASLKVKKIDNKWDVQIAGAETDKMAIEYNNLAVEEITKSLQSISGLTVDQYNEMTKLTVSDAEFNNIYQVYKQMIEEGVIAPPLPTTPLPTAPVAATIPAAPVVAAPPVATVQPTLRR